ncbi:hypothetical protein [Rhodopirellula baltica]|uniref:Uncharacterized protein n=1 Tax=Rhodopirellula baltica SWK14 TaxID=993516 RepID=L7C6P8_RHOBT|nr:hypothetical protein [Rhodopirellula baltica]ELP29703.1 hypothetical protein RBSWK_06404 [Rhodopirellula baltica SWK14]
MTADNAPATDAGRKHRDVTGKFARRFPAQWNELNAKNDQLYRNAEVANLFVGQRHGEGIDLLTCGTHREGDSPEQLLEYVHYCQKPYSCVRCASLTADYRAKQLMEASELFGGAARRTTLALHTYTIVPDTLRIPRHGREPFFNQVRLLNRFFDLLKNYHKDHNSTEFNSGDPCAAVLNDRRKKLLGPTVGSIHLIPLCESKTVEATAHAHLGVVMTREGGKKALRTKLGELLRKAKRELKLTYEPSEDEIVAIRKKQVFEDRFSIPDELKSTRWGSFDPTFIDADQPHQKLALQGFNYMSRPFKAKWSAEGIAEARQMVDMLDMRPDQLHRRFGMEGTKRKPLPRTPRVPAQTQLVARFNLDTGWRVFKAVQS